MNDMCKCGCGMPAKMCCGDGSSSEINYMFFGNLETMKRNIEEMLAMDPQEIDEILKGGHEWAVDHIASSVDDVQEVYNFLKNRVSVSTRKGDAFAEDHSFVKTFESYLLTEAKKAKKRDQDGDGDSDFADAKIAQYMAGGIDKLTAVKKSRKFNKSKRRVNEESINESKESLERDARIILSRIGYRMTELKQDSAKDLARILRRESKDRFGKEEWEKLADKLER